MVKTTAWTSIWTQVTSDNDVFAAHRQQISQYFGLLILAVITPIAIWHGLHGRTMLAAFMALAVFAKLFDMARIRGGGQPTPLIMLVIITAIGGAIWQSGINGLLWAYPVLCAWYFVLPLRHAHVMSLFFIVVITVITYMVLSPENALRVAAAMTLTLFIINFILHVVASRQEALQLETTTDPLTGAFNRRYFDTLLKPMQSAQVNRRDNNALIAIDIDNFKSVNDHNGHAIGDKVLGDVVALLQSSVRAGDILFQTGGDEFFLLLPGAKKTDASRIAEMLCAKVRESNVLDEPITLSMGVSVQATGRRLGTISGRSPIQRETSGWQSRRARGLIQFRQLKDTLLYILFCRAILCASKRPLAVHILQCRNTISCKILRQL